MGPEDIEDWDLKFEDVDEDDNAHPDCEENTQGPLLKVKIEDKS